MGIEDKEERKAFLGSLSLHELADTEAYYGLHKNANRMAETTAYTI